MLFLTTVKIRRRPLSGPLQESASIGSFRGDFYATKAFLQFVRVFKETMLKFLIPLILPGVSYLAQLI
jgi:hypothetical protein